MKSIEVQFLTREEMENARKIDKRYQNVDEDNLGFADVAKNRVYVLDTKDKELTKYLLDHEIDHLFEEKATHEDEHGIRHKKGGFFQNFYDPLGLFHEGNILGVGPNEGKAGLGDIPGVNTAVNLGLGAINPALGLAGQGLTSMKQPKASYQGDSFSNMFGGQGISQLNQASLGQGFGQTGSFSPSGMGGSGQVSPMANMGLSAMPNNANISMGNQNPEAQQRQSGFWNPTYKF